MKWMRHVLLGDGGFWGLIGTLLLVTFGVMSVYVSSADLTEVVRAAPVKRTCQEWLDDPSGPRWLTLTGCRLDLRAAVTRQWLGWTVPNDGGMGSMRHLELYIPIVADVELEEDEPPRAVAATTDRELLKLIDELSRLSIDEVDNFIEANKELFTAKLAPPELTGYVEPISSTFSRAAVKMLSGTEPLVLEQGKAPRAANAIFGTVLGLTVMVFALWPMATRLSTWREVSRQLD